MRTSVYDAGLSPGWYACETLSVHKKTMRLSNCQTCGGPVHHRRNICLTCGASGDVVAPPSAPKQKQERFDPAELDCYSENAKHITVQQAHRRSSTEKKVKDTRVLLNEEIDVLRKKLAREKQKNKLYDQRGEKSAEWNGHRTPGYLEKKSRKKKLLNNKGSIDNDPYPAYSMRKRTHAFNFLISIVTYGTWIPFWWLLAKNKVSVTTAIAGLIILVLGISALFNLSVNQSEKKYQQSVALLSDEEKTINYALGKRHPWIDRHERLKLAKMPDSLRVSTLAKKVKEKRIRDAEIERKNNLPINRWASCRFRVEQTVAGATSRDVRAVCGDKPR